MGGEEGVRQLPGETLQSKLDGKNVDGENRNSHRLVVWLTESLVKGAGRKEAAKESKAEGC